jgi:hypothetical protein
MRHLALACLLLAAPAASAQRAQPFDGVWAGVRIHECRAGGRLSRERITMQVGQGGATLPALLGDPDLQGQVTPQGAVSLPGFGTFRAGTGQITGNRFEGRQANRTETCWMSYDLRREESRRR